MKKWQGFLMPIGFLIYMLTTLIDRFVTKLPDVLYLPLLLIASACLVVGLILNRRQKFHNNKN